MEKRYKITVREIDSDKILEFLTDNMIVCCFSDAGPNGELADVSPTTLLRTTNSATMAQGLAGIIAGVEARNPLAAIMGIMLASSMTVSQTTVFESED